jgi:hypothetical protein
MLSKTKGTAYEAAIKTFIERKLAEQHAKDGYGDENDRRESNKLDLFQLSSSRYDSQITPRGGKPADPTLQEIHRDREIETSKEKEKEKERFSQRRLEELSKPLDSQRWKGPFVGHGGAQFEKVSTNHIGRQRPPAAAPAEAEARRLWVVAVA